MIEIVTKLVREQSPIYLTGEIVECLIEFTNPSKPQHLISQSNRDSFENLAWATVQIHCYLNSTFKEQDYHHSGSITDLAESTKTSLGIVTQDFGEIIVETKPKILFCDLRLNSGETKTYFFREVLPLDGPPTYRGHDIKYFYRITIATQRVKSKVQTLSVPIRVLPLPVIIRPEEVPALCNETNEELAPTNPFLENKKTESDVEIAWQNVLNITARRLPKFYKISNKRGHVGRFCLFKSSYKLGEDIVGTLDFTNREVRCVQFSVTLQSQEIIKKSSTTRSSSTAKSIVDDSVTTSGSNSLSQQSANQNDSSQQQQQHQQTEVMGKIIDHTKYHEVCLSMLQTQIIINVPLFVTPSFSTDLVEIKWRLHFEFVTSTMIDLERPSSVENELEATKNSNSIEWRAPFDIPIETMIWNLPVTLYPTSPLQIYSPSGPFSLVIK